MEHMLLRATNIAILNNKMKTAQQLKGNGRGSIGLIGTIAVGHSFETEVVSLIKNLKNELHKPVEQETVCILVYNKQHLCRWVVCYEGS